MKIYFSALLLTLLLPMALMSQTIEELDKKNGFKSIKIGDTYSKWKDSLTYHKTLSDGTKTYILKGKCCNEVFNYSVNTLYLSFYKDKLVVIDIKLEQFQKAYSESGKYSEWRKEDYESIKNSFSVLFGPPTDSKMNDGKVKFVWSGKKIALVSEYEYLGVEKGDQLWITVFDREYLSKDVKSGF